MSSGRARVLVLTEHSADDRKTLAAVRSLGRAGYTVIVASDIRHSAPGRSRYCAERRLCPNPLLFATEFADWVCTEVARGDIDCVLPLSDYTSLALLDRREDFRPVFELPVPSPEAAAIAYDKLASIRLAEQLQIGVPRTWCPDGPDGLQAAAREVTYPCVLKPRRGAGAAGLRFPESREQLLREYAALDLPEDALHSKDRHLIQEYVPGTVHDAVFLFRHGEPRAALTQKRLRMFPERGGVGVLNETSHEPELKRQGQALLSALNWHGPAMVEFKLDERDGQFKLMEINGRFWGTLDLAIRAGVDFPVLACRMAMEGDVGAVNSWEVGVRYRWNASLGWPCVRDSRQPWRACVEMFGPAQGACSDFSFKDPLPHLQLWLAHRKY